MLKRLFVIFTICSELLLADSLPNSLYDISVKTPEGSTMPLSALRGRVVLIVNTASSDRYATQMQTLEEVYQRFYEQGFVVLAFPSDDFMNEATEEGAKLRALYAEKFRVSFPVLAKVNVKGPNISPLYAFLTSSTTNPTFGWEVDWNFTKFLLSRSGAVINRFSTTTEPNDPKMIAAIEKALAEKS